MSSPQQQETRLSSTRVLKACDACKARKVRCSGNPAPCSRCIERETTCHFSRMMVPRRKKVARELLIIDSLETKHTEHSSSAATDVNVEARRFPLHQIHVDHLLANARVRPGTQDEPFSFKGNGIFLTSASYGLSFFSDSRILSLSNRLQNNKLQDLVKRISQVLQERAKPTETVSKGSLTRKRQNLEWFTDSAKAEEWIQIYFERVHPIYPFLDREIFEATTKEKGFQDMLKVNRGWSALYHCVLAIGCQHDGGGSFEPGSGQAWRLFSTSLALYPDLLTLPDSLVTVQAFTAMAIYSSGSCLSIEHLIIAEAARRIQRQTRTSVAGKTADSIHRVFWVLYSIEKVSIFYLSGRTSSFIDHDICCPIPHVPEAIFGEFDWLLTYARYSRLLSRCLTSLFSSGVIGNPGIYYLETIDQLNAELESWRQSIPADIRPGQAFQAHKVHDMLRGDVTRQVLTWTHYLYSGVRIILARATLQLAASVDRLVPSSQQAECKNLVTEESRSIIELTKYHDAEPGSPLWIMAGIPILALFTLFELVIFNPSHHKTRRNLALLDVAGGYFSRLEYASNGSLPSSLVSEFAYIAREYVNGLQKPETSVLCSSAQRQSLSQYNSISMSGGSNLVSLQSPPSAENDLLGSRTNQQGILMQVDFQTAVSTMAAAAAAAAAVEQEASMIGVEEMLPVESPSTTPMDVLNFPMGEMNWGGGMGDDFLLGTDVMDLFNYSIPVMDPFFAQGYL